MNNDTPVNPKKLFIGNLPYTANEQQLRDLFSPHGEIVDLKLIIDRFTGQSKGIAFVEFSTQDQADAAIAAVNDTELDGRKIIVNVARPPKPREDNRSFGGGGNNNFGGRPKRY